MNTPAETTVTGYDMHAAELKLDRWPQPLTSAVVVLPPLVIALERWVDEGGFGDDPDDTAWLNQTRIPPHRQDR